MKRVLLVIMIVMVSGTGFSQNNKKLQNSPAPDRVNDGLSQNVFYLSVNGAISDADSAHIRADSI